MLKHYRKKGTKEITHNLYTRKDNNYCFSEDKLEGDLAIFANKEDLNIYLEANDFEEVINEPKEDKTNLMPVVGKRYRRNPLIRGSILNEIEITDFVKDAEFPIKHTMGEMTLDHLSDDYEEIPEEPTNAKNAQVEETKEELIKFMAEYTSYGWTWTEIVSAFEDKAQNLLNALGKQPENKGAFWLNKENELYQGNEKLTKYDPILATQIMDDPDFPKLQECAIFVSKFFADKGIENWEFMELKSRWQISNKPEAKPLADNKSKVEEEERPTLEEVLDQCDNPDIWTPTQIICFISDYLDRSIGKLSNKPTKNPKDKN